MKFSLQATHRDAIRALTLSGFVPAEPLLTGSLGAALLGKEFMLKDMEKGEAVTRKERRLEEATFFD